MGQSCSAGSCGGCSTVPLTTTTAAGTTTGTANAFSPPMGCVTAPLGSNANDVAFTYTAPAAGMYTFDTIGSTFDTILTVLTGCSGTSLGCNDDEGPGMYQSRVSVSLTAGQAIVIVVDGYGTEVGSYLLHVTPPPTPCAPIAPVAASESFLSWYGAACQAGNLLAEDGLTAGMALTRDSLILVGGQPVTACTAVDYGAIVTPQRLRVVARGSSGTVCGDTCSAGTCGTGHQLELFTSPDSVTWTRVQQLGITGTMASYSVPTTTAFRYALLCRAGGHTGRDNVEVDFVEACGTRATLPPPMVCAAARPPAIVSQTVGNTTARACNLPSLTAQDAMSTGLAIASGGIGILDGEMFSACVGADFGASVPTGSLHIVARAASNACGLSCGGAFCGVGDEMQVFATTDGIAWQHLAHQTLNATLTPYTIPVPPALGRVRSVLVCRGTAGEIADHLEVDYIEARCPLPEP